MFVCLFLFGSLFFFFLIARSTTVFQCCIGEKTCVISRMAKCYVCEFLPQQRLIFDNLMQFLCFLCLLFCVLCIISRTGEDPLGYKL